MEGDDASFLTTNFEHGNAAETMLFCLPRAIASNIQVPLSQSSMHAEFKPQNRGEMLQFFWIQGSCMPEPSKKKEGELKLKNKQHFTNIILKLT